MRRALQAIDFGQAVIAGPPAAAPQKLDDVPSPFLGTGFMSDKSLGPVTNKPRVSARGRGGGDALAKREGGWSA
jgi:hypothetical protein